MTNWHHLTISVFVTGLCVWIQWPIAAAFCGVSIGIDLINIKHGHACIFSKI